MQCKKSLFEYKNVCFSNLAFTVVLKGDNMYSFKIKSNNGREYEGVAGELQDLEMLVERKIASNNIKGEVEIYSGRKLISKKSIWFSGMLKTI